MAIGVVAGSIPVGISSSGRQFLSILANGNVQVFWNDSVLRFPGDPDAVYFSVVNTQVFDAAGLAVGAQGTLIADANLNEGQSAESLAKNPDGSFSVFTGGTAFGQFKFDEFKFTAEGVADGSAEVPSVPHALSDGSRLVVNFDLAETGVPLVSRVAADGSEVFSDVQIYHEVGSNIYFGVSLRPTELPDGNLFFLWQWPDDETAQSWHLRAKILNGDGSVFKDTFDVFPPGNGNQELPYLKTMSLANGKIWVTTSSDGHILNADGTVYKSRVSSGDAAAGQSPVFADANHRVFVAFDTTLHIYDDNGVLLSRNKLVPGTTSELQLNGSDAPTASLDANGMLYLVMDIDVDGVLQNQLFILDTKNFTGTSANDRWLGGQTDDTMRGLDGNDYLSGAAGADQMSGGDGDDQMLGGAGNDNISGGNGSDTVSYYNESFIHLALDGAIAVAGAAVGDTLLSIENLVGSNSGDDELGGNAGANKLYGFGGTDRLYGRDGDDRLQGGAGGDYLSGGTGSDTASYYGSDGIHASLANAADNDGTEAAGDTYFSIENLEGSNKFNDWLVGNSGGNRLSGLGGDDYLEGKSGGDRLDGGAGNDQAGYFNSSGVTVALDGSVKGTGEAAGDTFFGIESVDGSKTGADRIYGNSKKNIIWGNGGNDQLHGQGGNDFLLGGAGKDLLDGGAGEDAADYYGAKGVHVSLDGSIAATGQAIGDSFISIEKLYGSFDAADILGGNALKNFIFGGGGNDLILGRGGDDELEGGTGRDKMTGGAGHDAFVFGRPENGADVITDFSVDDTLSFYGPNFKALARGTLPASLFRRRADNVAQDANDYFIFRTTDDTLWFDADGKGGGGPVLIVDLQQDYKLTSADIYIFD